MDRRKDEDRVVPIGQAPAQASPLPYAIELWDLPRRKPERIVGRAASAVLARAIFVAAQTEHLGRRIVLRRGQKVLSESG
jgi:hypothetical protein